MTNWICIIDIPTRITNAVLYSLLSTIAATGETTIGISQNIGMKSKLLLFIAVFNVSGVHHDYLRLDHTLPLEHSSRFDCQVVLSVA